MLIYTIHLSNNPTEGKKKKIKIVKKEGRRRRKDTLIVLFVQIQRLVPNATDRFSRDKHVLRLVNIFH